MRVKSLSTAEGRETSAAARHVRLVMTSEHSPGRPASETSFVAQILGESLGARCPLSNPGTLTARKSARIA